MDTRSIIKDALYKAAQGKVRNYALNKKAVEENCPGLYDTLCAIASVRHSDDVVSYYQNGVKVFAGVEQYTIPSNLGLTELLNFGEVYVNGLSQARMKTPFVVGADFTFDETKVVRPSELNGYWDFIETTAPNGFKFGKVSKTDYLMSELAWIKSDSKLDNTYKWEGTKVSQATIEALNVHTGGVINFAAFMADKTIDMSETGIVQSLAKWTSNTEPLRDAASANSLEKDPGSEEM